MIINTRRSIRSYSNKEVKDEHITEILKAAMQAPSARCQMPWEFLVCKDKQKLIKCAEEFPNSKMAKEASFVIVFMTNKSNLKTPQMYPQDLSSAVTLSLIKARELNIGSCWCGVYPHEDRINTVRRVFNVYEEYLEPFAVVTFGYPNSDEEFKYIDRFDEKKVHYEEI